MGVERIWCHARMDKVHFYERFGLAEIGQSFERDGKIYMSMSKRLATHELKDFSWH